MKTVELGFEIGTGELVEIPIRNMVVTGQTQEAGKTTTLEALIRRADMTAIAFVTKRGEGALRNGNLLKPYFRERADWRFVAAVLEATMGEKLKFERAWIMRASKGAKTLADVQRNVKQQLSKAKGLSADVYYALNEYLEIVVPRIGSIDFAREIRPEPATLNVVDDRRSRDLPGRDTGTRHPLNARVQPPALRQVHNDHLGGLEVSAAGARIAGEARRGRIGPRRLRAAKLRVAR